MVVEMKFWIPLLIVLIAACSDDSEPAGARDLGQNNQNNVADMANDDGSENNANNANNQNDMPLSPGVISVSTDVITFNGVRVGEERRETIAITNTGEEDIIITDVTVGEINRRGDVEIKQGNQWVDGTTILEGGTFVEIEVLYAPTDEEADRGLITINSTDSVNPVLEVRVETQNPYPDIEFPTLIRFGFVEVGQSSTQQVLLYNRGGDPLTIQNAVKSGLGPFTLAFIPSEEPPNVIEKDEAFAIDVTYTPTDTDVDRGTITVTSDDPNEPSIEIALNGNDPTACITVTPRVGDFGEIAPNQKSTKDLTIFNCSSTLDLNISSIELSDDGGGIFALENPPAAPLTLDGFDTQVITVAANLPEGERIGELTISSNDTSQPDLKVELRARTPEN